MPYKTDAWTSEQLDQMKNQRFMVDFLDTFKISPATDESDATVASINTILKRVEAQLTN